LLAPQAFRAIKCYLGKLEKVSENPDFALEAGKLATAEMDDISR